MVRVGVVGYGYWRHELSRKFAGNPQFKLVRIAEWDADLRAEAKRVFPGADVVTDPRALCSDPEIDLVVITTQATMQDELVRRALDNGKRVIAGAGSERRRRSKAPGKTRNAHGAPWYRTALCCASIFYLSSLPNAADLFPAWLNGPHSDKFAHALLFGGLAVVVAADLFRSKGRTLTSNLFFLIPALFATGYGLLDETHQLFVLNRSFDPADLLADAGGAILAAGAAALWYNRSSSAGKPGFGSY